MPDPIVKTVTVPLDLDRSFRLFTEEMADWWPHDTGTDSPNINIPDTPGEKVTETRPDGTTETWGTVTEHEPGQAFGMTWHPGRPEAEASHLRVTFDVVANGTRVTVLHDTWPTLDAITTLQACAATPAWTNLLTRFARHTAALTSA